MKKNRRDFIKKSPALAAQSLPGIGVAGTAMTGSAGSDETPFTIGYMKALLECVNADG